VLKELINIINFIFILNQPKFYSPKNTSCLIINPKEIFYNFLLVYYLPTYENIWYQKFSAATWGAYNIYIVFRHEWAPENLQLFSIAR
jgi:hypothetical protein